MLLPDSYLQPSHTFKPQVINRFLIITALLYIPWVVMLYWMWYGKGAGTFHYFNDVGEWLQMDKVGHFYVNFHAVIMSSWMFCMAGYTYKKAIFFSFLLSFIVLIPVEIMDGFSPAWGFSWGDMVANVSGALFAYVQLSGFKRIVFLPKFSYHLTQFVYVRPDMFGADVLQNSLKDYNGQTYWLTIDINKLFKIKILPRWLLLSIGYGGEGMYGGHDNVWTDKNGIIHDFSQVLRYRQWFLSFDINFTPLIKNKIAQRVLYPVNFFKVPFPALEISEMGVKFHWLYW